MQGPDADRGRRGDGGGCEQQRRRRGRERLGRIARAVAARQSATASFTAVAGLRAPWTGCLPRRNSPVSPIRHAGVGNLSVTATNFPAQRESGSSDDNSHRLDDAPQVPGNECGRNSFHHDRGRRPPTHQPSQRPACYHARSAIRRYLDRFRRCMGSRRSTFAHVASKSPLPIASKTPATPPSSTPCRKAISPPSFWSGICRRHRTSSIACVFRISPPRPSSVNRRSDASAPRRTIGARSVSSGQAIRQARAGGSMNRGAACAPTRPC